MQDWQQHVPGGNPVKHVRRPRIDNRRERRLRDGEWERLMRAAHECGNELMSPLLVLALETGMRRGELLSMQWRDLDSERWLRARTTGQRTTEQEAGE